MPKSKSTTKQSIPLQKWKPRNRILLSLPDQGRSIKISATQFGIQGRDRSWNTQADNFIRANDAYLKALELEVFFSSTSDDIELNLKANGIVGAVPIRAPHTHSIAGGIVVHPRYGWHSIGTLLSTLGWSASPEILSYPLVPGSAQNIPLWVIAGPAVTHLETLLKNLSPQFREVEEVRSNPRGQIQWQKYCTEQFIKGDAHKFPCVYSDLDFDLQLRGYIKWSLEQISSELGVFNNVDPFAQQLRNRVQVILSNLTAIRSQVPDHRSLDSIKRKLLRQKNKIELGFEAIRWILDERGIAGSSEMDGLAWRLPMHELFERWVEALVRQWAKRFGGRVISGRKFEALFPVNWQSRTVDSLSSLIPDVVVQTPDRTFVFDAKYKGFLDDVDERRWRESARNNKDDHRHDFHQALAYASLFNTEKVTTVLVYPVQLSTWLQANHNRLLQQGTVSGTNRHLQVALAGVPIDLGVGDLNAVIDFWDRLF